MYVWRTETNIEKNRSNSMNSWEDPGPTEGIQLNELRDDAVRLSC